MHWTERQRARVAIGLTLRSRGWRLYGFHEDRSDAMTDCYAPASWDGVAEKDGYVVVVDVGKEQQLCPVPQRRPADGSARRAAMTAPTAMAAAWSRTAGPLNRHRPTRAVQPHLDRAGRRPAPGRRQPAAL